VKERRAVITFDRCECSSGFDDSLQRSHCAFGVRQMLKHEANKYVIEDSVVEAKIEDVTVLEGDVGNAGRSTGAFCSP
jgi:hypothetical protein